MKYDVIISLRKFKIDSWFWIVRWKSSFVPKLELYFVNGYNRKWNIVRARQSSSRELGCVHKRMDFVFFGTEIVFQRATKGQYLVFADGENVRSLCKSIRERCFDLGAGVDNEINSLSWGMMTLVSYMQNSVLNF